MLDAAVPPVEFSSDSSAVWLPFPTTSAPLSSPSPATATAPGDASRFVAKHFAQGTVNRLFTSPSFGLSFFSFRSCPRPRRHTCTTAHPFPIHCHYKCLIRGRPDLSLRIPLTARLTTLHTQIFRPPQARPWTPPFILTSICAHQFHLEAAETVVMGGRAMCRRR